jgi:DNA-directed RNA polymerase specialized sigma24 family protein
MTQKVRRLNNATRALVNAANEKSILRAMALHDPNREGGASFTTYLKNAVKHNLWDQLRRPKKPTHQKILLLAHNGDLEAAHWWIDEETEGWEETKSGLEHVTRPKHIALKDRPLAHWLLDQHRSAKITWRHVLRRFPEYKTEDTAGRALRRVRGAIEKGRFYRF